MRAGTKNTQELREREYAKRRQANGLCRIPAAPITRVLQAWSKSVGFQNESLGNNTHEDRGVQPIGPVTQMKGWIGHDVAKIMSGRYEWIHFDIADKIITTLDPWLWFADEELNEIYTNFDYANLDRRKPTT